MQSLYGGIGDKDTCLPITPSKVFGFMYYQCYRKKRATNSESGKFDRVEYDAVLAKPNETEDKVDLLQTESIQHYLGAIRGLVDEQIILGKTETRREDIMTKSIKDLINLVKNRRERVFLFKLFSSNLI